MTQDPNWCDFGIEQANALPFGPGLKERVRTLKAKHHPIKAAPKLYRTVGRFNLLDSKHEQAQLRLTFDAGDGLTHISVTTEVDGFNDYQGDDPFEAILAIERIAKTYIGGDSKREDSILKFKRNSKMLKLAWLKERACNMQQAASRAARDAQWAYNEYINEVNDEE